MRQLLAHVALALLPHLRRYRMPCCRYDRTADQVAKAVATIEAIRDEWRLELQDDSIEFWSAAGCPTEPFQLAVSEETLKRHGTPEDFTLASSKKGTKRFYTPPLRKAVADYLVGNEYLEAALATSARRLCVACHLAPLPQ